MGKLTESDFAALEDTLSDRGTSARTERRRAEDKWRIDKTVSPSIIVTIVTFIVTGTLAYSDLKRSDDLLKADNSTLHLQMAHMESAEQDTLSQISAQYKELDHKVDRLIERQIPRIGSK
jgi:hypothetical protein